MLVLTRKIGETILVPSHGMSIQVISVKGRRVRLGIVAPRDTKVVRQEIAKTAEAGMAPGAHAGPHAEATAVAMR